MIPFARIRTALAALLLGGAVALPGMQFTQTLAPQAAHAASGDDLPMLDGQWHNIDAHTRSITALHIYYSLHEHRVQVATWGRCHPMDCSWGTVAATPFSFIQATATYRFGYATKYLSIWRHDAVLRVNTHVHFTDNSGRMDYDSHDTFARTN